MTVDTATLRRRVGAGSIISDADLDLLLAQSAALVAEHVGTAEVPDEILDRAHLLVAIEMYNQDQAPNGIVNQQYSTGDGTGVTPIRIGRDPLAPAYPLLAKWVSGKFWVG